MPGMVRNTVLDPCPGRARPAASACLVVIPARDEALTIARVVSEARERSGLPVLVVNDASSDETAREAARAGAEVLTLADRLGAWGAIQTGLRFALRRGYPMVVTMDADGQHGAGDILAVAGPVASGRFQVAIGSCPERGSQARKLAWSFFRAISGLPFADLTSGFRAYGTRAIRLLLKAEATLSDFQDMGVLLLAHRHGLAIREVPVCMRPRASGKSRIFASWFKVAQYMLYTTVVSLTRRRA